MTALDGLNSEQRQLLVNTTQFFKKCDGSMGEVPKEFKKPDIWMLNMPLLEQHADAINRWAGLPARNKKLVCESVEADIDSYGEKMEGDSNLLQKQSGHAVERINHYMQPEVLEGMMVMIDQIDGAEFHRGRVDTSLSATYKDGFQRIGKRRLPRRASSRTSRPRGPGQSK